jgi:hypothetical protein
MGIISLQLCAKICLYRIINSIEPRIALGARCNYSFLKCCTQILLCTIFVYETSVLFGQKRSTS